MAKNKKPDTDSNTTDTAGSAVNETPKSTKDKKKLLIEARERYKKCIESDRENRDNYRADMLFTYKPGEQWDEADKLARGKDRPMYEFNETRVKAMSVINHIRANRPSAKIRGVEEGDKENAETKQGICLNICNNSDFDSITDYAAGHQVAGGMGAWRVDTEYSSDTAFDQDIVIREFINPMTLLPDYTAKDELKRDAKYWFVHTKMPNDAFDEKYPDAEHIAFEPSGFLDDELNDEDSTWIAEYWKKVPITKRVCLLSNGETVEKGKQTYPEGVTIVRERTINTYKIVQYIISGDAVLEGPNDWAGQEFPFVPVFGYYIIIDGKVYWGGLTRYAKDPQRAHNWALTSVFESISSAPQSKYWATPVQAKGLVEQWAEANKKNLPAQLYNPDPQAPGPPSRMGAADVPVALIQAAGMSTDAMKAVTGIFNASLGQTSNETSGRAIRARQDEGMVATFNFGDNMSKSVRRTYEILLDLIPHIYDTERSIRILGQDGAEKFLKINSIDPMTGEVINDMASGKFDIVITTGPSYATQRQEAAEFYTQFSQANPQVGAAAADLIIKAQDYPLSDAIAERVQMMLPPNIQAAMNKDKPMPPEIQMAMQQVDQLQQQIQLQGQVVQKAAAEAQGQKADADKAVADVKVQIANLKVQEANLATDVANFKTLVAETQTKMAATQATAEVGNERQQLAAQVDQALAKIQQEAGNHLQQFAQIMAQITSQQQPQVVVAPAPPRPRVKHIERQQGKLVPVYEDQPQGQSQGQQAPTPSVQ